MLNKLNSLIVAPLLAMASLAHADSAIFTTPGSYTWTVPVGVDIVYITATGGGQGGAGGGTGGGGGGGGASSTVFHRPLSVNPGGVLTFSVGAGGLGGAPGAIGEQGGLTTLMPTDVSAVNQALDTFQARSNVKAWGKPQPGGDTDGGDGGYGGNRDFPTPVEGGAGGTLTTLAGHGSAAVRYGFTRTSGGAGGGGGSATGIAGFGGTDDGGPGQGSSFFVGSGGGGGGSYFGQGGNGGSRFDAFSASPGSSPKDGAYGAGGGGGAYGVNVDSAGGNGADGFLMIEW